jgi:hypothetical protein
MTVTTGPSISGTQSAEDDPSTPLAKPLGMLTRQQKQKKIKEYLKGKKKNGSINRTY